MYKMKFIRGLAAIFTLTVSVIATLFCDIIAYTYILFPPEHRLVYQQGNYALEVLMGVGGNFVIAVVLSAMLFFFARRKLISRKFHKATVITVSALNAVPWIHILFETLRGTFHPSINTLTFLAALLAYISPVIWEYILSTRSRTAEQEDGSLS